MSANFAVGTLSVMGSRSRSASRTRDTLALAATLADYWLTVFPRVRRELARWRQAAEAIPDDETRALALATLEQESGLAEGAAIFATLVPRRHRRALVPLLVAWQVAYDYLDTLGERPRADAAPYAALAAALDAGVAYGDPRDGGYLHGLIARCRTAGDGLPALDRVRPVALRAVQRCIEGQLATHAVGLRGNADLRSWAAAQSEADGYLWWEVAAGAISSLAVHAVLATAAHPCATSEVADAVDAAYFPSICALSTLLDSAVDTDDDDGTANHRCLAYYDDPAHMLQRLAAITHVAERASRALPAGRRHAVILAGMTTFYATAGGATQQHVHRQIAAALGAWTPPILWSLRLRSHCLGHRTERGPPSAAARPSGGSQAGC